MKYLAVFRNEVVGNPECPMMHRTGFALGGKTPLGRTGLFSVRLHRFCPNYADDHPHDHPWPFVTLVIKGSYIDIDRFGNRDLLRRGSFRYRPAQHAHRTFISREGCMTIVITGPVIRQWGFWSEGNFYSAAVKALRDRFGHTACE